MMFCFDVPEIFFTEKQRWNHVVGGRERVLPCLDRMLLVESGGPGLKGRTWWLWVIMISIWSIGMVVIGMLAFIRGDAQPPPNPDYSTDNSQYTTTTTTA